MANRDYQDSERGISDGVDDAVVANADAQEPGLALERRDARGAWVGTEVIDGLGHAPEGRLGHPLQRPFGRGLQKNSVTGDSGHSARCEC